MLIAFLGLAMVPLALALTGLFFLIRNDVAAVQGSALKDKALLLAGQIQSEIHSSGSWAVGLASLPQVRDHLRNQTPYPEQFLSSVYQQKPGLRQVKLTPALDLQRVSEKSKFKTVLRAGENEIEYQVAVADLSGKPIGILRATFDLGHLQNLIEGFRTDAGQGRAVLGAPGGQRLIGPEDMPAVIIDFPGDKSGWLSFEDLGKTYFAGYAPIAAEATGLEAGWFLAVLKPAEQVFAHYFSLVRKIAFLLVGFGLLAGAGAWRMADHFLRPILEIRQGAEIISRTNLAHRIKVNTGDELEELARELNRMAESLQGTYNELEERVCETTGFLQGERNRLATVLRTMVEGVVVTNDASEVLLMNPRARLALDSGPSSGIGISLARLVPAARLEYHLKRLIGSGDGGGIEEVVFPLSDGKLLRGFLTAIAATGNEGAGFLFVFRDMSEKAKEEEKAKVALRELPEILKGPMGTIRSLAEVLDRHPDMPAPKLTKFLVALRDEAVRLSDRLSVVEEAVSSSVSVRWPGIPAEPWVLLEEAVALTPEAPVLLEKTEQEIPMVLVEPYTWVCSLSCVLRWIMERYTGSAPIKATVTSDEEFVFTTFQVKPPFPGSSVELEALLVESVGEGTMPLGDAVRRNLGELWSMETDEAYQVRLALVQASTKPSALVHIVGKGRPDFYDFDLFLPRPSDETEELLRTPLELLEFVVFDSETTGLHPSQGDKIVSLSAVRIRRGKLQYADIFDTMVNPGRNIPSESIKFHGITEEMAQDAPTLEQIYPKFVEYVSSAVLVAHSAGFDKKFLDMAAAQYGMLRVDNPILDTLFLSVGIHKDLSEGHSLDDIAKRLGVKTEDRHSSLSDCYTTGRIFLRLLPLLKARGVNTLHDAKTLCDRMLLLRWQQTRF
jgi:DNA polymerase-3 subunit epsilon